MNYMTNIFGLLLFFFACQNTSAQPYIQFEKGGFAAALEKSKKTNKPLFFMCYASWCPHCHTMREHVFTDSSVVDFYNRYFICVEQDMEKDEGIKLHKDFNIKSYPTLIYFDSNGKVIYRTTGELQSANFISEGLTALTPEKQLPFLKQQFELDISNSDKCYDYLVVLKNGELDYSDVVKKYFSTQKENDLLSEKNWKIIANGTTEINSREFQFLLSHQKEFASLTSAERVERKIVSVVKNLLSQGINEKDSIHYFANRKLATDIHLRKIDSLIFISDIKFYENTQNWDAYKTHTLQLTATDIWNNYGQLNAIATIYLYHISDSLALVQSINWTAHALALHEDYGIYILSAKLHQKINDKKGVIKMAKKGKELALKYGWDYDEADKLLKEYNEIK